MDSRGAPLRPNTVQKMADLLLANRDALKPPSTVRINQVRNFVRRNSILKTRFSRKYDYQRALYKDSDKIQKWFKLVRNTIKEQGITDKDIYNFNETGFAIGIVTTVKIII